MSTLRPILLLPILAGCAPADPGEPASSFDPALAARLQAALDDGRDAIGAPGAVLAVVHPEEGLWIGTSGTSDLERPVAPDDLFRIGSITKIYVGVVLVQLAGEGRLELEDPVAWHVPWAPHGERITVHQLLTHTSGLPDHVSDLAFLSDLERPWTAEEMVALVADQPLRFAPGSAYAYTNAGYVLLGEVIAAVTGRPWGEAVVERILEPLGLTRTFVPSVTPSPETVRGYLGVGPDPLDVTDRMHPVNPHAAGEIVASAADVARFGRALFVDGVLLDEADLDRLLTPPTLGDGPSSYALGVALTARGDDVLVGHSGSTMGFQSRLHVLDRMVASTQVNDFYGEADEIDGRAWDVLVP